MELTFVAVRLTAVALVALVVTFAACSPPPSRQSGINFDVEVEKFSEVESKAVDAFNEAIDKSNAGNMDDEEFVRVIEVDVLPGWREGRKRMSELQGLNASDAKKAERLVRYALAREKGWETIVDGLRAGDSVKVDEGFAQVEAADEMREE